MRRKLSIIISIALCTVLVLTMLAACKPNKGNSGIKDWESNEWVEADSPLYRDYYQIFIYSFCDSNGDGIGDFKGIESKLDYIADLGFNGIWLSPIHPSSTEHCYDVEDYKAVNSKFGTMQDFDDLVKAAHNKGISIMLDLVINHSSNKHPWFVKALSAYGKPEHPDYKYVDYYLFHGSTSQYEKFGDESTMPKLNLDNANVRAEIEDICKFWLQSHNVDAFRLDAAWHFYNKIADKNVAFMQWLYNTAKKYNPDIYMVGEVLAGSNMVFPHYAENSVQSFFNFDLSSASGFNKLMMYLNVGQTDRANKIASVLKNKEAGTAKGIDALFASNHDTIRFSSAISYVNNRTFEIDETKMEWHKMSVALLYTQTGNVFNYFGNEIGMRTSLRAANGAGFTSNSYLDYMWRTAMNWGVNSTFDRNDGFAYAAYGYSSRFGEHDDYLGGVAEQIDDQNSVLNFYRRIMTLRRQNPEIAQGKSTFITTDDSDLLIILREYKGSKIVLIYNLSAEFEISYDVSNILSQYGLEGKLAGFLSSNNDRDVTMTGDTVTLPQYSIALIR